MNLRHARRNRGDNVSRGPPELTSVVLGVPASGGRGRNCRRSSKLDAPGPSRLRPHCRGRGASPADRVPGGAVCFGRGAQHLFTFEPGTLSEEVTTPHCLSSSPLCITVSRKSGLDSPDSVERARYFPSDGQAALATTASMPDWRCVGEVKPLYRRPCPDSLC